MWPFDTGTPGINPNPGYGLDTTDYRRSIGYDPKMALWSQLAQALQQAGAQIAMAPPGKAVGKGLLGALQGSQAGQQDYEAGLLNQLKWKQYAQDQARQEAQARYFQPLVAPSDSATPASPLPFNRALDTKSPYMPAGGSGVDTAAADPFADLPDNVRRVAADYVASGDYEGARKVINDFRLSGGPKLSGPAGELKDAITGGFVPPDTTLDEFMRIGKDPSAPIVKDFIEGNRIVQKQWNPKTGGWDVVGQGDRWQPQQAPQTINTLTIKMPDGSLRGFANTDIDGVKAALNAGGIQVPSSAVNITLPGQPTIGTIPPGYQATQASDGSWSMSKIPGGPADVEQQAATNKANAAANQKQTAATIVTQDIDRAIDKINSAPAWTTGFLGDWLSNVGGTTANDVRALLLTVKANASFDRLQQMRDASPTGGALGQVSEMELQTLQSAIGNLEQSQSKKQLVENLKRVQDIYRRIIDGPRSGPGDDSDATSGGANSNDPLGLFN